MTTRRRTSALRGGIAAILGLAAGDLVATLIAPAASPMLVVGSTLIDLAPTPVKTAVIEWFGTADKPILVALVIAGTVGLGAVAGLVSRRWPTAGAALIAGLSLGVVLIAATRPTFGQFGYLPALVTGIIAVAALLLLGGGGAGGTGETEAAHVDPTGRRRVLVGVGLAALTGVAAAVTRGFHTRSAPVQLVALPAPTKPLAPLPRGLGADGITALRTPVREFYRVDTRLRVPTIDPDDWQLTIDGDVGRPVHFTYKQLLAMPLIERDITLVCVSNPTGGPYAGGARWTGVRLTDLLDEAGKGSGTADQILSTDVGGMTISTPLDAATDGRDAMIAIGMNGRPLPREHGFPARLIVPALYGFIGATKWITRMTLTTYAEQEAYWTKRGWATAAPIKLASRIDTPQDGARIDRGDTVVGGIAWAHADGGVAKVQIRIDDEPWRDATLGPSGGSDYWRQWFLRWDAPRGKHTIVVRTVGADGDVQTGRRADIVPDGATGHHTATVTVA